MIFCWMLWHLLVSNGESLPHARSWTKALWSLNSELWALNSKLKKFIELSNTINTAGCGVFCESCTNSERKLLPRFFCQCLQISTFQQLWWRFSKNSFIHCNILQTWIFLKWKWWSASLNVIKIKWRRKLKII